MTMILFLGEWLVRSSTLILAGALLLALLRVKNPSVRLTAWTAILAGSLSMPLLTVILPKVPLPVLRPLAPRPPMAATASTIEPDVILPGTTLNVNANQPRDIAGRFDWMRFAAVLYALAAIALLVRLFGGLVLSLRIRHRSSPTGIMTEGIDVRESDRVASPVTLGVLSPVILLPLDWREWDAAKLEAVLVHERSHISRRDPAVQFVSAIHRALLWANPLSWFLDRSIVRTAELISDDDAVAAIQDRASYAEILLQFVERGAGRTHYSLGVPMARYDSPEKRIRRILDSTAIPRAVTRWGMAAILGLGSSLVYLAAAANPQPPPRPATVPTPMLLAQAPVAPAGVPGSAPAPSSTPPPAVSDKAQTVALPEFEVASIKPVEPDVLHRVGAEVYPGGRVILSTFNLKSLIAAAFGLSYWQISGGEEWIGKEEYKVEANPSEAMRSSIKTLRHTLFGIEDEHLRQMLQALLMDRFQLKYHRETKTGDVYLLKQSGKTLRLRSATDAATGESWERNAAASHGIDSFGSIGYAGGQWTIFATSMPQLAKFASTNIFHVPVLDRTGLSDVFDYRSQPDIDPVYVGDQSGSFRSFLEEAGLKLERAAGPIELFVIDHAAKPSPN